MNFSRRQFLGAAGGAAALAATPLPLRALAGAGLLYPPADLAYFDTPLTPGPAKIRIGYAAITWGGKDTEAIDDISSLGYRGIQLRANAVQEFPDPHALQDKLAQHNLKLAAFSSGDISLDPAQQATMLATHEAHARYIKAAGCSLLQLIGTSGKNRTFTAEDYKRQGQLLTEVAKRVADYGVQTGFHNHMGTIGQSPEQVDRILEASDPRYVKLELDTGHYVQGGGDAAAAVKKYASRLLFLHLKDVKSSGVNGGYEFTELGRGRVDFPAFFAALRAVHFRGWGIIELDGERSGSATTPKESAAMSKQYLEHALGVTV